MYKCGNPNLLRKVQTHWVGELHFEKMSSGRLRTILVVVVILMNYFIFFYPEKLCERNRENLHVSSERVRMFQST